MTVARDQKLRRRLEEAFEPQELLVKDQSQLHIGHEGARDGKGHFDVMVVSTRFEDVSRLRRHQMIYDAVRDLIESDIHALRIRALTPAERDQDHIRMIVDHNPGVPNRQAAIRAGGGCWATAQQLPLSQRKG